MMSVITQVAMVGGRPFPSHRDNSFALLNEIMISLYLYILLPLTNFMPLDEYLRFMSGLLLVGVICANLLISFLKMMIGIIESCFRRRRINKKR